MAALAQGHDTSLTRVTRAGRIRFVASAWMAVPVDVPGAEPILTDPFNHAVARLIATGLGLDADIQQIQPVERALATLNAGEADVAIAPILNRRNARAFMFAIPHASLDDAVFAAGPPRRWRELSELVGWRFGAVASYADAIGLGASAGQGPIITRYQRLLDLATAIENGEQDGAIASSLQGRRLFANLPGLNLRQRFTFSTHAYGAAVAIGDHDLLRAINAVLAEALEDGRIAALFRQTTGLPYLPVQVF